MKITRLYISFILCALCVISCTEKNDIADNSYLNNISDTAIGIFAETDSMKTRSVTSTPFSIENSTDLQTNGFKVYAYYHGTNNFVNANQSLYTIMDSVNVKYQNGGWVYDGDTRYWPLGKNMLSFLATSYNPNLNKTRILLNKNSSTGNPEITYIASTDLDKQEDILWGTRSNGMPYINETRPSDGLVHWHFKHALAKIVPTISSTLYTQPYTNTTAVPNTDVWQNIDYYQTKYLIKSITISNANKQATLSLQNSIASTPAWNNKIGTIDYLLDTELNDGIKYTPTTDQTNSYNWNKAGIYTTTTTLLPEGQYLTLIPKLAAENGNLRISVTYETLTQITEQKQKRDKSWWWYGNWYNYGSPTTTYTNQETTIASDINTDFIGGRKYQLNINIQANYIELTAIPQPWEDVSQVIDTETNLITIAPGGGIEFDAVQYGDSIDRTNGIVYLRNKTCALNFNIATPRGATWRAALIQSGDIDAFQFVDENGTVLSNQNPQGNVGTQATLRVRAKNATNSTDNSAILRIYVIQPNQSTIVKTLTGSDIFKEYKFVEPANVKN
ncbi:fimbrillin family protein [Segatella paludivivens]|uniref:fimbrillin family protein n=1 Tax=Segatella paludivivens TaxID=185294 RepID=UPI00036FD2BC|nr:fimbrillin family protein [Segatella paludivivens]